MEGKDTVQRTIKSPKHMNADHPKEIKQSSNKTKDNRKHNKQLYNQENHTMVTLMKFERLHQQGNRDCVFSGTQLY